MMLKELSAFPRLITIDDRINDKYWNGLDMTFPFAIPSTDLSYNLWGIQPRKNKNDAKEYKIIVNVGKKFTPKDIQFSIEGRKLKVVGKMVETVENGTNDHEFDRIYEIPDEIDIATHRCELTPYGYLVISFDRKFIEPRKEFEDISTDNQYHVKLNFPGFKPSELSIKLVGREIIIEGEHKTKKSDNSNEYSSEFGCLYRKIVVGKEVDIEKLRVFLNADGVIEVTAPKDSNKLKPFERVLKIESV